MAPGSGAELLGINPLLEQTLAPPPDAGALASTGVNEAIGYTNGDWWFAHNEFSFRVCDSDGNCNWYGNINVDYSQELNRYGDANEYHYKEFWSTPSYGDEYKLHQSKIRCREDKFEDTNCDDYPIPRSAADKWYQGHTGADAYYNITGAKMFLNLDHNLQLRYFGAEYPAEWTPRQTSQRWRYDDNGSYWV